MTDQNQTSKKIVIAGGGFGGISAAKELAGDARFDVTLISPNHNFEYHAALYRSSTGRSVLEVSEPLADIFKSVNNIKVVCDSVAKLDSQAQTIATDSGNEYEYDELILALGVTTEYYGINGLKDFSYGIKSVDEAMRLKNHLHSQLEKGSNEHTYVVVGGGPTGIELAAELVFYLKRIRAKHNITSDFRVVLVEAAPKILPVLPATFTDRIHKRLQDIGVEVKTGVAVEGETLDDLELPGEDIKTHTVIWTAGVTNNLFFKAQGETFILGKGARVQVDDKLSALPNVYVLGDSASTELTGWAQTALQNGRLVAQNLKRSLANQTLATSNPTKPIAAIPVGPKWCAASNGKVNVYGYGGWLWRRWLDWQLYLAILPFGMAVKAWFAGTKREESCPACK